MAKKASKKIKTEFALSAPAAKSVKLAGSFTDWGNGAVELRKLKNGVWKKAISLEPGCHQYKFIVDGEWQDDPECSEMISNEHGGHNCVRIVG